MRDEAKAKAAGEAAGFISDDRSAALVLRPSSLVPRLSVLNVAYPLAPVGDDAVGGAEQIVTLLDSALVRAGHESLVVACEGSRVQGTLVATPTPAAPFTDEKRREAHRAHRAAIDSALRERQADVVHLHGVDFYEYLPAAGVPALATLHLPPAWYPPEVFRLDRPQTSLNPVSRSQAAACPPCPNLLPAIGNGVCVEAFAERAGERIERGDFALCLGRVCYEKGFDRALRAARVADVGLLIGGEVFPYAAHESYFREQVAPLLDDRRRFLGALGFERKRRLLRAARCLVAASRAEETSSLVTMEAFAAGTPVVAFRSGALCEIIEDGVTGFLVESEAEMARAILAVDRIDPEACRRAARERFDAVRMTDQYLALYARIAAGENVAGAGSAARANS